MSEAQSQARKFQWSLKTAKQRKAITRKAFEARWKNKSIAERRSHSIMMLKKRWKK